MKKELILFIAITWLTSFLAHSTEIKIALENLDNSPYEMIDEKSNLTGFHIELIEEALKGSEFKIKWIRLPWTRAIEQLKSADVHAVTYLTETEERKKFAVFLQPNILHQSEVCLIAKDKIVKQISKKNRDEDLKKFVFLSMDQYEIFPHFSELKKKYKFKNFTNRGENIYSLLQKDRGDISYTERETFYKYKKENSEIVAGLDLILPCYPGINRYLGFNKKYPKMAEEIGQLIQKYKQSEKFTLLKTKYHLTSF
jgi:hypothetical protein